MIDQTRPGADDISDAWWNNVFKVAELRNFCFANMLDGSAASKPKSDMVRGLRKMAKAEAGGGKPLAFAESEEEARWLNDQQAVGNDQAVTIVDGGTLAGCFRYEDVRSDTSKLDPLTDNLTDRETVGEFHSRANRVIDHLGRGQGTLVIVLDVDTHDSPLKLHEREKRAKSAAKAADRRDETLQSFGISGGTREAFGERFFSLEQTCATEEEKKTMLEAGPLPEWICNLVPLRTMLASPDSMAKAMPGPVADIWASRSVGRPEMMATILVGAVRSYTSAPAGKRLIITGVESCLPLIDRLVEENLLAIDEIPDAFTRPSSAISHALVIGDGKGIVFSHMPYYGEADHGIIQALAWPVCSGNVRARVVSEDSDVFFLMLLYHAYRTAPPDPAYAKVDDADVAAGPNLDEITLIYKISSSRGKSNTVRSSTLSVSRVASLLEASLRRVHGEGQGKLEYFLGAVSQADLLASLVVYAYYMGYCDYLYGFPGVGVGSSLYALDHCNPVAHMNSTLVSVATCPAPYIPQCDGPARHPLIEVPKRARLLTFRVNGSMLDRTTLTTMAVARIKSKRTAKDMLSSREMIDSFMFHTRAGSKVSDIKKAAGKLRREYIVDMTSDEMGQVLHFKAANAPLSKALGTLIDIDDFVESMSKKGQAPLLLPPPAGEVAHRAAAALAVAGLMTQAVSGNMVDQTAIVDSVQDRTDAAKSSRFIYMSH